MVSSIVILTLIIPFNIAHSKMVPSIVKWSNCSIWPKDGTQIGTTTLVQSGLRSNGNEKVRHMPQSSKTSFTIR